MNPLFPHLASPLRLGSQVLRNRIVFSAHLTNYAETGMPTDRYTAYYAARARGGAAMIITEEQSVHPSDHPYEKLIQAFRPEVLPHYERMTQAVHRYGARILAQLNHNGGQASSTYTRSPVLAPSSIADPLFREVPKALEANEIAEIVDGYATVAERCQAGGFDGVELQCSHSSLVRQFLSRHNNKRTDAYGGDLDGRMRFLVQVIEAIRARVREDFVLGVRLCGEEFIDDGIMIDEAVETAVRIEAHGGVDYINTSIGTATQTLYLIEASMHVPPGYALYIPAAIRRAVHLPVVAVGRVKDPIQAEQILASGIGDMVGIVRAQIADPDFARKALEGMAQDIRVCLSCNQECVGRMGLNRWMGCIETVSTGREQTHHELLIRRAKRPRRVGIVGGGPGGLEAARIAGLAGHEVVLFERSAELGGAINIATRVTNRAEFGDLARNLIHAVSRLQNVELRRNHEVTEEELLSGGFEHLVIATGARYDRIRDAIPGAHQPWVLTVPEVLAGGPSATLIGEGRRVLLVDGTGFHDATSTAEFLVQLGAKVHIVSSALYVGGDLGVTLDLENWYRRMRAHGVRMTPNIAVLSVGDGSIAGIEVYTNEPVEFTGLDALVLALPPAADDDLYRAVHPRHPSVIRVGDCAAPRRAHAAIIEGHEAARAIPDGDVSWVLPAADSSASPIAWWTT